MLKLERYLRPYWAYMALTMAIKLLGAVLELKIPDLMETILDEVVFIREGQILLHKASDQVIEENGEDIDHVFRKMFAY